MRSLFCSLVAVLALTASAAADITVDFAPYDAYIDGIGNTVEVDIIANISPADAIVGWGMDVIVDDPSIADITNVELNLELFESVIAPDGDSLVGLATVGDSVWGTDIVLATLTFTAYDDAGAWTEIWGSDDNPTDLTEGFALDGGGFANVTYSSGFVNVVPEPASLTMLGLGMLLVIRRR